MISAMRDLGKRGSPTVGDVRNRSDCDRADQCSSEGQQTVRAQRFPGNVGESHHRDPTRRAWPGR
jgi:hypothetical protein